MQHVDSFQYPALAWTREGQPFHPAPRCVGWRVFRCVTRGRPTLVYDAEGPLHLDLDCDFNALRECAGPGRYVLHQVDAGGSDVADAPAAYVTVPERESRPQANQNGQAAVQLALATQQQTIEVLSGLLTHLVNGTATLQKATAELLASGSDAVSIASGAGLPEHVAALMPKGDDAAKGGSGLEGLLNSPVVASALMGLAQAMQPPKPAPAPNPERKAES
ncbi:hypothetical protein [Haliangium ochraceum]|uniref:Uncharacterized protein n=1 Tax=Haliangium ochraceum (strain DSM 14365 / JCM 11303 / SMP-2) TaxID=502025 RepID=D0LNC8_HALO1|nr:hypothetical protein [Haliangium ochraceum]ACY15305.1 hypothetical protein Hoch_2778 [Haliangium ochraceum DSM 14365]